jgi:hypothetical protein
MWPLLNEKMKKEKTVGAHSTPPPPLLIEAGIKPLPLERHWKKGE